MKTLLKVLLAASASLPPAAGQISVTIQAADQAMIPGSVRPVYASVKGTNNLAVRWTTSGGCTLASPTTTAAPLQVTAPSHGASCKFTSHAISNQAPSFSSSVACKVIATSAADPSRSASIVLPVCAPQVELNVFPETTVLYKNQFAVVQSDLRGSVNTAVTWTITSNSRAAAKLTGGTTNRHAVFSASVPGIYTLTATSKADPRKKASATLYVTAHNLPAPLRDHTEPVDCTAVGNGKTYEVGPARAYADLNAVPWGTLHGGDTVRIHNDDASGSAPTTYHQHISISESGAPGEPLRICGVPDQHGIKPILDGANATSPKDADWAHGWLEGLGLIVVYDRLHQFDPEPNSMRNILIEGLHLRNARPAFPYTRQKDGSVANYAREAACFHIHSGRAVMLRGNELENCAQGIFANSQTPQGSVILDLTVEGNSIHTWGQPHNFLIHAMYLQTIGLQVQFNYFGAAANGAIGNMIKSRSVLNFLRWNYISQTATTARAFDMVEPQSYDCYVNPHAFAVYHTSGNHGDCNPPRGGAENDPFSPDQVAANFEAFHSDYVYGNILDDSGSGSAFIHYGYDQQIEEGPRYARRGGTLFYYDNTHLERKARSVKSIFDTAAPDSGHSYEFPVVQSINNVFSAQDSTVFQWVKPFWSRIVVNSNWINPGSILPNRDSKDSYQGGISAAEHATCDLYGNCHSANGRMVWQRAGKPGTEAATLYTGPTPFDLTSFLPKSALRGLAAPLPAAIREQPSNMQFLPGKGLITPRRNLSGLGALAP